jgi:uroporphyrinogen III methyltransferase/synthase
LSTTVVASIGPVTAEAAQQLGIQTTVMPKRYTVPDLVDALVEHFARGAREETPQHI